jgi:hypothetical protein
LTGSPAKYFPYTLLTLLLLIWRLLLLKSIKIYYKLL